MLGDAFVHYRSLFTFLFTLHSLAEVRKIFLEGVEIISWLALLLLEMIFGC